MENETKWVDQSERPPRPAKERRHVITRRRTNLPLSRQTKASGYHVQSSSCVQESWENTLSQGMGAPTIKATRGESAEEKKKPRKEEVKKRRKRTFFQAKRKAKATRHIREDTVGAILALGVARLLVDVR